MIARDFMHWLLLGLVVLATACGGGVSKQIKLPDNPETSFVFLFIDMARAPTKVGDATLRQVAPQTEAPYWVLRVDEGVLYREALPSGAYVLDSFDSGSGWYFFSKPTNYRLPTQGNPVRLVIEKPGVYFAGAFAYKKGGGGFFSPAKFDIVPIENISEKQVLGRILRHVQGTEWESRVREHYDRLP